MNHTPAFVISEFTNPSGEIVFRVAGWLDGKRVRKNFTTRTDAEAERQILEIHRLQTETGIRVSATRLEDAQLKEAEAMFARLAEGASLEERGVRATVALYCIRPDLIGEATLEEIGHVGGRSRQAVHQLADSFRATTGMAS
jgi:hypothetical protein